MACIGNMPGFKYVTVESLVITYNGTPYPIKTFVTNKKYIVWNIDRPYQLEDTNVRPESSLLEYLIVINDNGKPTIVEHEELLYSFNQTTNGSNLTGSTEYNTLKSQVDKNTTKFNLVSNTVDDLTQIIGSTEELEDGSIIYNLNKVKSDSESYGISIEEIKTKVDDKYSEIKPIILNDLIEYLRSVSEYKLSFTNILEDTLITTEELALINTNKTNITDKSTKLQSTLSDLKVITDSVENVEQSQLVMDMKNKLTTLHNVLISICDSYLQDSKISGEEKTNIIQKTYELTTYIGTVQNTCSNITVNGQAGVIYSVENELLMLKDKTSSSISALSHTTEGLVENIETQSSEITQLKDSITQRVSSVETALTTHTEELEKVDNKINNAIDNIEIGGRNLILLNNIQCSGFDFNLSDYKTNGSLSFSMNATFAGVYISIDRVEPNTEYTLSYSIRKTNGTLNSIGGHCDSTWLNNKFYVNNIYQDGKYDDAAQIPNTNDKYYVKVHFITPSVVDKSHIFYIQPNRGSNVSVSVIVENLRLGRGNNITDWSPAPEDIESEIYTVDTKVETTKEQVSSIVADLNGITERVGYTENSITSINGNVVNVSERLGVAENSIKYDSIISTVSSEFYKKGETDEKYASQSQITQLDNKIATKVDVNGVKTTIEQSPTSVQMGFNGVNNRYVYTNDGFYMKHDNGNNKASFKRGSFYTYNYVDGTFLGGLTPFLFGGIYNAGQGIINSPHSYFFTIGKDNSLSNDEQDFATNLMSYFTLNFRDRDGEGNAYKYGMQVFTPSYFYGDITSNGSNVYNVNQIQCLDLQTTFIQDRYGNKVFNLTEYDALNYKNWDWGGKNLVNCNLIGTYDTYSATTMSIEEDTSLIDNIHVVKKSDGKLGLVRNITTLVDDDDNFEYSQLIYSLVEEIKKLKEEVQNLKDK